MSKMVLALHNVVHTYREGEGALEVLRGATLEIGEGEIVALVGPSGAGKSTLLHIAGLLEAPTAGEVLIQDVPASHRADTMRTAMRRDKIGFVYQFHHLLAEFSAVENVAMPLRIAGVGKSEAEARARDLLTGLGLGERLVHRPAELSGGEQQRVAIARALANRPALLLADEPTGNLDPHTSARVFDGLVELTRKEGVAALIATHNFDLARTMDRAVTLEDGQVVSATL